jgi:hypothetical protein
MNVVSARSILVVAALQATVALAAMPASATAALAAAALGALALARYIALSAFVASMGPSKALPRALAASAWILGLAALLAGIVAVALRARPALPWAVAAALVGPLGMSMLALGSGLGALVAERPLRTGGKR